VSAAPLSLGGISLVPLPELNEAVERVAALLGPQSGEPESLDGGITNRNFKVAFGGTDYVVRLPGKDTEKLGIDRATERDAGSAAAALGIAPKVALLLEQPPCLVTEFVVGRTMEAAGLRESVPEVARVLRAFHDSGTELATEFDSFRVVESYASTARANGVDVPEDYKTAHAYATEIEKALQGHEEHLPVPCHNDLLAANFINDGLGIVIVDWEYAGMGDRYFDLANFSINNELDAAGQDALLAAYFGEPVTARRHASLQVMRFMSDFREAMWGVVQRGISELEFDFAGYAAQHFERLWATFEQPFFGRLVEEAGGQATA
jgi:thiamine kinase-like enzyme